MTPEQRAAILEHHQPKPNRDYTDCAACAEGWPCETAEAMQDLAAERAASEVADARAVRYLDVLRRLADAHDETGWRNGHATGAEIVQAFAEARALLTPGEPAARED